MFNTCKDKQIFHSTVHYMHLNRLHDSKKRLHDSKNRLRITKRASKETKSNIFFKKPNLSNTTIPDFIPKRPLHKDSTPFFALFKRILPFFKTEEGISTSVWQTSRRSFSRKIR